jgi:lysozyme
MLRGIDVSSYQGAVDWGAWKGKGIAFAIAKATEGRTIRDSEFARNWRELKPAGLVRGAYHFTHPRNDANADRITVSKATMAKITLLAY